jgi:hypothetical protein
MSGEAETEAWTGFLRGLVKRGRVGVQLATSRRPATGSPKPSRTSTGASANRDAARRPRTGHPGLLRVPELALAQAQIRLAGMLCIEQNEEWLVGRGYLSAQSISLVLAGPDDHTDKENKEEVAQLQAA